MNKQKGFISLLLTGLIFGSFGIWIRLLNRELTSFQQIALRNFIGLILSVILILIFKHKWEFKKVNKLSLLLYAFSYPIAVIFYVFAFLNAKIATVTFAFYAISYLVTFILGTFYFKDKLTLPKILGLVLAAIGLIFLSYPFSLAILNLGLVYAMVSGLFDSGTNTFRRLISGKVDRFVLVAIQMLAGVVVASVLLLIYKQPFPIFLSSGTLGIALIFGFLLMSVSFLTLIGFQNFDLGLGTIVMSSELLFAPLFAFLVFRETLSTFELIGGIFILFGIIVANLHLMKLSKRPS